MFCIFFLGCLKKNAEHLYDSSASIEKLIEESYYEQDKVIKSTLADTIYQRLKNTKKLDSSSRMQYLTLAGIYYSLGQHKKYFYISNLLLNNPDPTNNNREKAFCNLYLGAYFYENDNYLQAFTHLSKAENYFRLIGDRDYLGFTLNLKSSILSLKKDYAGSEILAIESLKIGKENKNYNLIYNNYITLGNSSAGLDNFTKAIEYYQKAIQVSSNLNLNSNHLAFRLEPLNYISTIYQKQELYKNSVKFAIEGLKSNDIKINEPALYCYLTNNLAYSELKLGILKSPGPFFETLEIGNKIGSSPIQITSKTYLGEYFLNNHDTNRASYYLVDASMQAHENSLFESELKILQLLWAVYPQKQAVYMKRYIELTDSLHKVERSNRNKFARIEFETEEITTERNSLSAEKKNLILQRWLIAGTSILLIITILLWIKNKSQKVKTKMLRLEQEQQKSSEQIYQLMLDQHQKMEDGKSAEKQRISLDLHDGVMGRLSAVRLNLYASLFRVGAVEDSIISTQLDEIQKVEKEIRNITHNLNKNIFSGNSDFIEIVHELFERIKNHSEIQFKLEVSDGFNWELIQTFIKINLYRILQEALQNIIKYSNAKSVIIIIEKIDLNFIKVTITDNGQGFDTSKKAQGIGIENMKKRTKDLKGQFDIHSEILKGTKISLIIPI